MAVVFCCTRLCAPLDSELPPNAESTVGQQTGQKRIASALASEKNEPRTLRAHSCLPIRRHSPGGQARVFDFAENATWPSSDKHPAFRPSKPCWRRPETETEWHSVKCFGVTKRHFCALLGGVFPQIYSPKPAPQTCCKTPSSKRSGISDSFTE